jgi:hypothetical protein
MKTSIIARPESNRTSSPTARSGATEKPLADARGSDQSNDVWSAFMAAVHALVCVAAFAHLFIFGETRDGPYGRCGPHARVSD